MRIPHHHYKRPVSEQFPDAPQIHAAHDKSARECVPQVMPVEVIDLRILHCRFEPAVDYCEGRGSHETNQSVGYRSNLGSIVAWRRPVGAREQASSDSVERGRFRGRHRVSTLSAPIQRHR